MKTIFIVNPKAGQGKKTEALLLEIKKILLDGDYDGEIYLTKAVGDARDYVETYCKKHGPARFIACGGDGTLSEVLCGAMGCSEAQVGVIPVGTGNDFCRNFDKNYDFFNILAQLKGSASPCDAIYYRTKIDGAHKEGFCVNMANIGFDCNVADLTNELKKKPFIFGKIAYFLSILICMIKKKGADLTVSLNGEVVHKGRLLLTSIANGSYCGGGIKSNPLALVSDGVLNVNIIKNIRRLQFIPLLPPYMKGTILQVKNIEKYLINQDCETIHVIPNGGKMRVALDGEIIEAGDTEFRVVHKAFNLILPENS